MITTPVKLWRRQKQLSALIGKTGLLLHWTIIRVPAKAFFKEAPYPVVIVQMENNQKMIGQLVDWNPDDLRVGRKLRAVLRRAAPETPESIISYIIKFTPHHDD